MLYKVTLVYDVEVRTCYHYNPLFWYNALQWVHVGQLECKVCCSRVENVTICELWWFVCPAMSSWQTKVIGFPMLGTFLFGPENNIDYTPKVSQGTENIILRQKIINKTQKKFMVCNPIHLRCGFFFTVIKVCLNFF